MLAGTDHVQRILHRLGGRLDDYELFLLVFWNLKSLQKLSLFLQKFLFPLFVPHFIRTCLISTGSIFLEIVSP